ncbi:B-cell differentiation antigen CD72 [Prionailurus bengalensis]|uniref:B-cell differentiation antigen CD72 n=1 Tax=Prionailurus bengalensis TaxID=37029 RepID=UPI001AD70FF8|nr:B-cell differentiation antigen CD72 isoform X1 [Puma yagouaroundi]XP_043423312.1 B-cell differentiation antigen CD72 [Prionailurus bengalensis]XP_046921968.1 B-cell differentiation antigen CD72 isoform X2 [Lynx rufus]
MAEAITYADLRFVKAPLKKSVSSRSGQEADEDEELTYENVQVPSVSVSGGPLSLASSGVGDKADWSSHRSAGLQAEQPTASWSSVASPAAGRILTGRAACTLYLFLGLLLACLLLGVAAICLGVRYLQVSQQLQQMNSVLEATNSSLRQQLHLKITQLGKREEDLQGSKRELALSQEALQEEQRVHQATQEQLQACQSDREKTKEALQSEEVQRRTLEQRLSRMKDTMKPLFTCPLSDTCCPSGWILSEKSCFYISLTARTWDESQNHCKSLSSDLATFNDIYYSGNYLNNARKMLTEVNPPGSFWAISNYIKMWQQADSKKSSGYYGRSSRCYKVQTSWPKWQQEDCTSHLPCICEMAAFGNPDKDYSLP